MSFLKHIEEQKKLGNLSNKDALDMKMNYMTLSQKEKSEIDSQYSSEDDIINTDSIQIEKEKKKKKLAEVRRKKLKEKKLAEDKILKENLKKYEQALKDLLDNIVTDDYEVVFEIYTIFKKYKFIVFAKLTSLVKEVSKLQWRDDY